MLKIEENALCRVCKLHEETLDHILVGCPVHYFGLYKEKHDKLMKLVAHKAVESVLGRSIKLSELKTIESEKEKGKVVQDTEQMTIESYSERRPDIIIYDYKNKIIYVIEIAVSHDSKVVQRASQKKGKYHRLSREMAQMNPSMKVKVVPFVVGNLGTMTAVEKEINTIKFIRNKKKFLGLVQLEVLTATAQFIKSHFAFPE